MSIVGIGAKDSRLRRLLGLEPPIGIERLHWHEERLHRAAHPLVYPFLCRIPGPVQRIPGLGVFVRDTELMREVLLDLEHFSKRGPGASSDLWTPILGPSVLLNMTGEDHIRMRRMLQPLFSRRAVDELVAQDIDPVLEPVKAALKAGEAVDMVAVARQSASRFIASLAGIECESLNDELFNRITAITRMVKLSRPRFPEKHARRAREILREVTDAASAQYRAGNEATVPGRMRALGLSEEEAIGAVGAFIVVGTETVVSYVPRLLAMLADSGWAARAAADSEVREACVQEGLRVTTPTPVMLRATITETKIGSVRVRPGDRIILSTFLANRQPGSFNPLSDAAAGQKQLWFGAGVHFCIGAPLALAQTRAITDVVLGTVQESGGTLTVASRSRNRRILIPSYKRLMLRIDSEAALGNESEA